MIDDLKNIKIKIEKNDFEYYKNKILNQRKLRKYQIKNLEKYLEMKKIFSPQLDVRIKKIGKKNGLDIWLVDGPKIRRSLDIDFTMGGHGLRYLYIPLNEIWIDSAIDNENDIEPVIYHEITEFNLMKEGLRYDEAHTIASIVESIQRENIARKNEKNIVVTETAQ
ncbi:MAG: hypothetical protein QXD48_03490 [Candidatus Aenigmatarchaeota archaeon]